jgi:predicted metal-dependent HD superfamily phosphohydrolase
MPSLQAVWAESAVALGGSRDVAERSAAELARRYAEPHRRYHTADHVNAVLEHCAELGAAEHVDGADYSALALAACAHDVVYAGQPGEDERASARWAAEALVAAGVADAAARRVEQLVLVTADHVAPSDDPGAAILVDADLAVLGGAPADYDRYAARVRQEYPQVDEAGWRAGRAAVLTRLLARDPLYRTTPARRRWAAQARANMTRELAALAG